MGTPIERYIFVRFSGVPPAIDATNVLTIIHQNHNYSHLSRARDETNVAVTHYYISYVFSFPPILVIHQWLVDMG